MTSRAEIVSEAYEWLGTPFCHHQGRKGIAADCAGFVLGVAQARGLYIGVTLPPYLPQPDPEMMLKQILRHCEPISYKARRPGDLLYFRMTRDPPTHMGVIINLEPHWMIHAWGREGIQQVKETRLDKWWIEQVAGCYQYKGIAD